MTDKKRGVLRLVLGGSGYGKSDYVFDELINASMENPDKNYIVVVPEQFTMATQSKLVAKHPNHGVLNIDIMSFNRLAFRVFEELGISSLSVLDDTGKTLILKKIIGENKDRLTIYKNKVNQPGFVEEMKSAVSELYSYGINPEKLEEIVEKTKEKPYITEKLKDIHLICSAFKEALGERYITKEEIPEKLCSVIANSRMVQNSEFVFDGFTGFTPVQNKLLGLLLELDLRLTVTVTIESREAEKLTETGFPKIKEQELFNLSKTTINKLFAIAAEKNIAVRREDIVILAGQAGYRHRDNEELAFLERNLFRAGEKKGKNSGKIKLLAMESPVEEAAFASSYINHMVRREGYRYRDFAVITGSLDTYRKPVETAFYENEIPYFMDNKRRLILNPCVAAIRHAIRMVREDFSYESVFGFLRCGMSGMEKDAIDIFENYVLEYGVRGWKKYEKPFVRLKKKSDTELLARVNESREKFVSLIEEFKNSVSGRDKTVGELTRAVYEFGERLCIYDSLKSYEKKFTDEGRLSLSKEYSQTYGLLIDLYEKFNELMGEAGITLREYEKLLEAGLEEIKVGVIPLNVDTVVVGDIERTRLTDIKVLIVLGVNDGIIPKVNQRGGLLTGKDRGFLKKMQVELSPAGRESIFIQRFYLYQNLTKPSDRLLLTYSERSAEGSAARKSYLINTIGDMYEDREVLLASPIAENIFTKEMGMKYISEHFVNQGQELSDRVKELYSYFYGDKTYKNRLMHIVEGAYFTGKASALSGAVASALYGEQVIKSATRLEKYAACAYAHFLAYGLQLAERRVYEINAADVGTLYHRLIEMFSKELKKRGLNFRTAEETDRQDILESCVEELTRSEGAGVFLDTERNKRLLDRIKEVSARTVWAISEHIKAGDFDPEDFELSFSDGRIDRVDVMEREGEYYVKIIDYKSGNKRFDMEEVMNGLQIQLIYYMGAVMDIEGRKHEDKTVIPAGAFYFNIKSPYIERMSDDFDETAEEYRQAMLDEYKMTGLANSDSKAAVGMDRSLGEGAKTSAIIPIKQEDLNISMGKNSMGGVNFVRMIEYVRNRADKMCEEILEGNIKINPYKKGTVTPCNYCAYKGMCTFNEKVLKGRFRTLNRFEPEDIYRELQGGGENGSDLDR